MAGFAEGFMDEGQAVWLICPELSGQLIYG
jgi:hypothetical protein